MSDTIQMIWLNGEIMPLAEARIGVEDRGFQFADGVYEVIRVYHGQLFTLEEHLQRLWRSAVAIQLTPPMTTGALGAAIRHLVQQSGMLEGMVYLQLTRGVAARDHVFPREIKPTLLFYTAELPPVPEPGMGEGIKLLSMPDERWKRCWIKTVALLSNVLAKNTAIAAGADETAFVDGGTVTECAVSNLFAVINGKLVTHPVGSKVLAGITRMLVLKLAAELEIPAEERAIQEEEAPRASEMFITNTTRQIAWVSRWNDIYIGAGRCGAITLKLQKAFAAVVTRETASA